MCWDCKNAIRNMLKITGLLIAAFAAFSSRLAFAQQDPIQVTVMVTEITFLPKPDGESGTEAVDASGTVVHLPFTEQHALPIRAEFSVVPGVLHKQRIIAGGADLYLELTLTPPENNSTTAKATFFFHKQDQPANSNDGVNIQQNTHPFTSDITLVVPFTGSSVELGKRMERFGELPNQTVVSTHISVTVLPPH